ncbi:flavodoxin [Peptococcus simiae]|uniref:Flavodoxin n=1 Tax=Peptococcus simiae TaxID=1643805 RepID=A0ABW9GZQ4_9FIRM
MSKITICYWSGTGNTENIANLVAEGAKEAGAEVTMVQPWDTSADDLAACDKIAFGCPAMGDEQLETEDFQPLWDDVKDKLKGKKIALFGSYNWNSGEWMDTWAQEAAQTGATLVADGLAILDSPEPGSDEEDDAKALGAALAKA